MDSITNHDAPIAPAETWAKEKSTPAWLFAAARAANRWPIGREMTESAYDAAIKKVQNLPIGG